MIVLCRVPPRAPGVFGVGLLVLISFLAETVAAFPAAPCSLSWMPDNSPNVAGYAVYYGPASSPAANRLDAGKAQTATIFNLTAGSNYSFYVVSYNAIGIESSPSNIVAYRPPAVSNLQLIQQANGAKSVIFLAAPGVSCHVQYASSLTSGVWNTLGSATADSSGHITINDPSAGQFPMRFYRAVEP